MKKRTFLKNVGILGMVPLISPFTPSSPSIIAYNPKEFIDNEEELWTTVRSHYQLHPDFINLESGYYNIIPQPTVNALVKHIQRVNLEGSLYMREHRFNDKYSITNQLAKVVGCSGDQLIITRNTTESLDLVIGGFPWKKGDEAIHALQDYGAMQDMFTQIADRHGVIIKKVSVPNHPKSDEEIVALYESQITSKTKLMMVCHMINITGHILPIKKICEMAHRHGVEVMVDGAHCIGHFDFKIEDLNCDYYGSSLHKWLATPLGAGLLYIKKEHTSKLWPLLADGEKNPESIVRLSHVGTHPVHTDLTIVDAMEYLQWIGIHRKENRLRSLKERWLTALKDHPNIKINTPFESEKSCGIGNIGLKNMTPAELAQRLFDDFKIFTVAIDYANVQGCRISPNVFTSVEEIDIFVEAMKTLATA